MVEIGTTNFRPELGYTAPVRTGPKSEQSTFKCNICLQWVETRGVILGQRLGIGEDEALTKIIADFYSSDSLLYVEYKVITNFDSAIITLTRDTNKWKIVSSLYAFTRLFAPLVVGMPYPENYR